MDKSDTLRTAETLACTGGCVLDFATQPRLGYVVFVFENFIRCIVSPVMTAEIGRRGD
jgi:hypothetical protein